MTEVEQQDENSSDSVEQASGHEADYTPRRHGQNFNVVSTLRLEHTGRLKVLAPIALLFALSGPPAADEIVRKLEAVG